MKKLLLVLFLYTNLIFAQNPITLTSADMPTAGWSQIRKMDTLPLPTINFGNKGASQVYDFSNLVPTKNDTVRYQANANTAQFPNADIQITTDNINYLYTKTTPNVKFDVQGVKGIVIPGVNTFINFNPVNELYRFPTQYGGNFSGNWGFTKTLTGNQIGQSSVDSVRVIVSATFTDTIDGWGKVITPYGTYDCLRQKRKETTTTTQQYLIKNCLPPIIPCGWQNVSNPKVNTLTTYNYLTKEAKGSVLAFEYDTNNVLQDVRVSLIPPPSPVANFTFTLNGGIAMFTDVSTGYKDRYHWDFGDGDTSNTQNPNHTYSANGTYNVCLTVYNGTSSHTYCQNVVVTGISAGNNAPVAVTDTYNLKQPSPRSVHVATNDLDADNDNICVDGVWGSPFVTELVGGSCDWIQIAPDSTFTGTDTAWYRLCDNGSPVLCDTGMIIFTVEADPTLLPTSTFTALCNSASVLIINQSNNETAMQWIVTERANGGGCNDSIFTYSGDTVRFTPVNLCGQLSGGKDSVFVCAVASNQFGKDTGCQFVCTFIWMGINEESLSNILLYPNPASHTITIDMGDSQDDITFNYKAIEVFNILGERQKQVTSNGAARKVSIDINDLAAGAYVAAIVDNNGVRRALGRFTVSK